MLKKNGIYIISAILLVGLIAISFALSTNRGVLKEINYTKYESLLKESQPQVVYLNNDNCAGCVNQKPILESIGTFYDMDIHFLKLSDLTDVQISNIALAIDEDATTITAPSVLILKDNNVIASAVGYTEKSDLVEMFKKNQVLSGLIPIDIEDYYTLIAEDEVSFIYVGKKSCQPCQDFQPVLKTLLKDHNTFAYYLDVDKMSDEEKNLYMESFEALNEGIYTPHLLFVKQSELLVDLVGVVSEDMLLDTLRSQGMIE